MKLETKKYLYDIARAAAAAGDFVDGKTFEDYSLDIMLRSAVERQLEIVGEPAQLARIDPATGARISEYKADHCFPEYSDPWICRDRSSDCLERLADKIASGQAGSGGPTWR